MNSVKHIIPESQMKQLYFTLIHPYISYGILLWGNTYDSYLKPLVVRQKMAIRAVCNSAYNAHTSLLFAKHQILKLKDLFITELCIFMFKLIHNILPSGIQDAFTPLFDKHSHQTRSHSSGMPFKPRSNKNLMLRSLMHTAPTQYAKLPIEIQSSNNAFIFKRKLKSGFISKY